MGYLLTLAGLNLFDGLFTYWGLMYQWIEEANPFMRWLWDINPVFFMSFKVFLSVTLCLFSFSFKRFSYQKVWKFGLTVINMVYSGVILLHFYWVSLLLMW